MNEHRGAATGRTWPLIALPVAICALGIGVAQLGFFQQYRDYVSPTTIPEALVRSGQTGKQLGLILENFPVEGLRLAGFDMMLPQEEMPSTTILGAEAVRTGLPIMSIVVDPDDLQHPGRGIVANYNKRGFAWERPAYVSYFRDGHLVFATGAGLRIHGGASRRLVKKSFRLHFREPYGLVAVQRSPIFGGQNAPMSSLVIHNDVRVRWIWETSSPWHYDNPISHFNNPISYEIAERIGSITPGTQPVKLYINGTYHGPYVLKERVTSTDFLVARFGHDDFVLADAKPEVGSSPLISGDEGDLEELHEWPRAAPAPLDMEEVARKVDLENLTNWFISVLYPGTTDLFQGVVARDRSRADGRWFWINWDMDHSFIDWYAQAEQPWKIDTFVGMASVIVESSDPRAVIFNRLRTESPEYRVYFLSRLTEVLNHELTPEFMEELIDRYEREMLALGMDNTTFLPSLRTFFVHRPAVLREQMDEYFSSGPSYKLTVKSTDEIGFKIDGRDVGEQYSGWYFADTPARIEISDSSHHGHVSWVINGDLVEAGKAQQELNLSADTVVELRVFQ